MFLFRQPTQLSPARIVAISPALSTARAAGRVKPSSLQPARLHAASPALHSQGGYKQPARL